VTSDGRKSFFNFLCGFRRGFSLWEMNRKLQAGSEEQLNMRTRYDQFEITLLKSQAQGSLDQVGRDGAQLSADGGVELGSRLSIGGAW
jgi:hypothetical protein